MGIKPQTLVLRDYAFLPLAIVMGKVHCTLYKLQTSSEEQQPFKFRRGSASFVKASKGLRLKYEGTLVKSQHFSWSVGILLQIKRIGI